ncbi:hypothetical protein GWI33_022070 [Rhynchophorus ferrugineus]|uniref:Uncharacterized protein n=1 Tax=Rhynchophorus ferrugineus TaxID=354439 RepID=A0A834MJ98_RHYFE|nr:hypothetical protein GWI33_022070 [Rhynchophorus ferrugineus]
MLVVDRNVFDRLQADRSGLDLLELGANIIRHQVTDSTPSILDSDTTSKGISPLSLGRGPPAYEDIFGDLPPSYSEVSIMLKNQRNNTDEAVEMTVFDGEGTARESDTTTDGHTAVVENLV